MNKRKFQQVATCFGAAEQIRQRLDYVYAGPMRSLADAALTTVRDALEPAIFAEAFAAGQQMALAEAFVVILAPPALTGTSLESKPQTVATMNRRRNG